jgi:hypothetical protein
LEKYATSVEVIFSVDCKTAMRKLSLAFDLKAVTNGLLG